MIWSSASEFISMGGYGLYVWGSFGVTALLMIMEVFQAARQHKSMRDSLRIQAASQEAEEDWP